MNMTLTAAVRLASGHSSPISHKSAVRSASMMTRRSSTTLPVSRQGMSVRTRSYPMVSRMMALVGAEMKLTQASNISLTPVGFSASYRPVAPSSTPAAMARMMGERAISRSSWRGSAFRLPSSPSRILYRVNTNSTWPRSTRANSAVRPAP